MAQDKAGKLPRDERLQQGKPQPEASKESRDEELEQELEDSFPASDPPQLTRPDVSVGGPPHDSQKAVKSRKSG